MDHFLTCLYVELMAQLIFLGRCLCLQDILGSNSGLLYLMLSFMREWRKRERKRIFNLDTFFI